MVEMDYFIQQILLSVHSKKLCFPYSFITVAEQLMKGALFMLRIANAWIPRCAAIAA